ncbi:MAG: CHAT domain-containing protein [Myxococcales bacterium]|nr:CHAT domain-containing protein [Myxococcales bacterium]
MSRSRGERVEELGEGLGTLRTTPLTGAKRGSSPLAAAKELGSDELLRVADVVGGGALYCRVADLDATAQLLRRGRRSSGASDLVIEHLALAGLDEIVGQGVDAAVKAVEQAVSSRFGLFQVSPEASAFQAPERWTRKGIEGEAPALLLLHGAFSLPEHSFRHLGSSPMWTEIVSRYPDRVFAFASATMSESPITNALTLVEQLAPGAQLDILSYSRGGLIGELLAWPPQDLSLSEEGGRFERWMKRVEATVDRAQVERRREAYQAECAALSKLRATLEAKHIRVRRHVRVGSPVGGTPLAGKRLNTYLSIVLEAASALVPGPSLALGLAKRVVLEILRRTNDPRTVPGLVAMDPQGALVGALQRRGPASATRTLAVAGTFRPTGLLARAGMLAVDYFYGEPNDLVVPTASMWLAPPSESADAVRERVVAIADSSSHHFGYFTHPEAARALLDDDTRRGVVPKLVANAVGTATVLVEQGPDDGDAKETVFLLPGIMGSTLGTNAADPIWINVWKLRRGRFDDLDLAKDGLGDSKVGALSVLAPYYGSLHDALSESYTSIPWEYDWRKSILESAEALKTAVETRLAQTLGPVHFVAHSMGGLVVTAMLNLAPELKKRLQERDSRFVMLGTPLRGAIEPLLVLSGRHRLLAMLDAFDGPLHDARAIVRSFPGLVELLDPRSHNARLALDLCRVDPDAKSAAEVFWQKRDAWLAEDPFGITTHYVFGKADRTPDGVLGASPSDLDLSTTPSGDGTVPWSSAAGIPSVQYHYADAEHGAMPYRIEPRAILDMLAGRAWRSSSVSEAAKVPLRKERPSAAPLDESLLAAAFGSVPLPGAFSSGARPSTFKALTEDAHPADPSIPSIPLRPRIVHGALYTGQGVLVLPVFSGEPLSESGSALDRIYRNRLGALRGTAAWPTCAGAYTLLPEDPAEGAPAMLLVHVGLRSRLTKRGLRGAVRRALTSWSCGSGGAVDVTLSFEVPSVEGQSALGPEEAFVALIEASVLTNRAVASAGKGRRIACVEVCEPYRDLANRFAASLRNVVQWFSFEVDRGEVDAIEPMRTTEGFYGYRTASEGAWETWSRIQIDGRVRATSLRLTVVTGQGTAARCRSLIDVPLSVLASAEALADESLDRATAAEDLYAAITNRRLRLAIDDGQGLVLDVDARAAAIPWELLLPDVVDGVASPRDEVVRVLTERVVNDAVVACASPLALVVGNPQVGDLPDLPGAAAEANEVASAFARAPGPTWGVTHLVGKGPLSALSEVSKAYRVVHFATHGRVNEAGVGELYLGDNFWDGPRLVERMTEVPQLAFLNACFSGRSLAEGTRVASSVAQAFLRAGVRVVVVTGWAVGDAAAATFAKTFYDELLRGETFGRAVRRARRRARLGHPGDDTWAAYQCYGEPSTILFPEGRPERRLGDGARPRSAEELVDYLVCLHGDARILDPSARQRIGAATLQALGAAEAITAVGHRRAGILLRDVGWMEEALAQFGKALEKDDCPRDVLLWWRDTEARLARSSSLPDGARAWTSYLGGPSLDSWEAFRRRMTWLAIRRGDLDDAVLKLKSLGEKKPKRVASDSDAVLALGDGVRAVNLQSVAESSRAPASKVKREMLRDELDRILIDLVLGRDVDRARAAAVLLEVARLGPYRSMRSNAFERWMVSDAVLVEAVLELTPAGVAATPEDVAATYASALMGRAAILWASVAGDHLSGLLRALGDPPPDRARRMESFLREAIRVLPSSVT